MTRQYQIIPFLLLSVVFIILDSVRVLTPFHSVSDRILIPVQSLVWNTVRTIRMIPSYPGDTARMVVQEEKIGVLEQSVQELSTENRLLKEENQALRDQISAPLPASYQFTPARVLGKDRFLEIGAGSKDGVSPGMTVITGSTLIGIVTDTVSHRSSVRLLSDPDTRIPVKTQREIPGMVGGGSQSTVRMDSVLQKDMLLVGDSVITSGTDQVPPNLVVGTVRKISGDDVNVYKTAVLEPVVSTDTLSVVFIITSL